MERAVIYSDLKKQEIQPQPLLEKYLDLMKEDISKILPARSLLDASCPVTGESEVQESFSKLGMDYQVSQTLGNIYLSQRPSMNLLKQFYVESSARKFWLKELWPQTAEVRKEKILLPQLGWAWGFISQYSAEKNLCMAEFLPNHWGYRLAADEIFPNVNYRLIDPLFDTAGTERLVTDLDVSDKIDNESLNAAFLFEALDRSPNPAGLLESVKQSLKPGGLCFVTCLLASGFEVQILGKKSEIFVPPERMNLLSYEGINMLIKKTGGLEVLEFSTPGVLDIPNVISKLDSVKNSAFFNYLFSLRQDARLVKSFQDFLQLNCLGTFGRLVLRKK